MTGTDMNALRMHCLELALRMSGNDSVRAEAWGHERVLEVAKTFEQYVHGEQVNADAAKNVDPAP